MRLEAGIRAICNGFIRKVRAGLYPACAGIAVFFAYPSMVGYQDVAMLLDKPVSQRWLANMVQIPGETTRVETSLMAKGVAVDPVMTGTASAAARKPLEIEIATQPKLKFQPQRITSEMKGDRVVTTTPKMPPA